MADRVIVALSSCPDSVVASTVAETLVTEGLAACVNQISGTESVYFWDGRLQHDHEVLLIIKTTASALPNLESRLKSLHPYELPELVAIPSEGGSAAYLDWVARTVSRGST